MKAKLQIGNEMREGELTIVFAKSRSGKKFSWVFEGEGCIHMSLTSKHSKTTCKNHFKSIGGIIGDAA